jgi:hypothetical protein
MSIILFEMSTRTKYTLRQNQGLICFKVFLQIFVSYFLKIYCTYFVYDWCVRSTLRNAKRMISVRYEYIFPTGCLVGCIDESKKLNLKLKLDLI